MGGITAALRWWEEWQLRILVLSSLFVQGILFFSVLIRSFHGLRRLRAVVWIAYIGSDALAIYALATLFNRHKEQTTSDVARGSSSSLEIIWAPVLLIHLGGQQGISAYSLEDNELWKRHVITLVCQVTVALYVFCKWWSGEERQLQSAILLFVVGIFRFSLRPWILWGASFNSMMASADLSLPVPGRGGGAAEEGNLSVEEFVQEANKCTHDTEETTPGDNRDVLTSTDYIGKMFVDMSCPYSVRLKGLRFFLKLDGEQAHKASVYLRQGVFRILYTGDRARNSTGPVVYFTRLSITALVLASLVLFAKSHKDGYDKADVTVTYILFGSNVVQQFARWLFTGLLWIIQSSGALEVFSTNHDMVSQYNLMSLSIRKKNPTILMKLAGFNCLISEYINKHCYIEQVAAGREVSQLVSWHVKEGWNSYIIDAGAYKRFNNHRGQGTLRRHQHHELEWSLKMSFDESVLLWHIATDLCFFCFHDQSSIDHRIYLTGTSRWISNYMAYLLLIRPEMLMPGTRPGLFNVASYEIELILRGSTATLDNEEMLARELMDTAEKSPTTAMAAEENYTPSLIPAACRLAKALMGLEEKARWKVIQGVWLEMLCYSASRCRGYLHAKSLGQGGEYLTTVWLLWSYMGMDTFTYMLQSPELPPQEEEEEGGGGGVASTTSQSQQYPA